MNAGYHAFPSIPTAQRRLDERIDRAMPGYRNGLGRGAPTAQEFLNLLDGFADEVAERVSERLREEGVA